MLLMGKKMPLNDSLFRAGDYPYHVPAAGCREVTRYRARGRETQTGRSQEGQRSRAQSPLQDLWYAAWNLEPPQPGSTWVRVSLAEQVCPPNDKWKRTMRNQKTRNNAKLSIEVIGRE